MRKFGPKKELYGDEKPCPACGKAFVIGDYSTLIVLGPGDDEDERKKRDEGRPYNAICVEVHWDCARRDSGDE